MGRLSRWWDERQERKRLEEEEREHVKLELNKIRKQINYLLDQFTMKHLNEFCGEMIGRQPSDELVLDEDESPHDSFTKTITYGKKMIHKFDGSQSSKIDRRTYVEFVWKNLEDGRIKYEQIKSFALRKKVVHRGFFGSDFDKKSDERELRSILAIIQKDFEPENIQEEDDLQAQLTIFLKATFLDRKIEREKEIKSGDKLDILIDDRFVLELKVPKTRTDLRNLTAQIEEYLEEYPNLAVVIADASAYLQSDKGGKKPQSPVTDIIDEYVDKYQTKFGVQSLVLRVKYKSIGDFSPN